MDNKSIINANAWVQTALNMASEVETAPVDLKRLKGQLPVIKELCRKKPEEFLPELRGLLSQGGGR